MSSFLFIIGGLWMVASVWFVLAFAVAGRKTVPVAEPEAVALKHAA
jgi:hypothetical protein